VGTYKCGNSIWLFTSKIGANQAIGYKHLYYICQGERSAASINNSNDLILVVENNLTCKVQFGQIARNFDITWNNNETSINQALSPSVWLNDNSCFIVLFHRKDRLYHIGGRNFKGKLYLSSAEIQHGTGKDGKVLLDNDGNLFTVHQSENFLQLYCTTGNL